MEFSICFVVIFFESFPNMGKVKATNNNVDNNIDKPKSSKTNKKNSIESQVLEIVKNADKLLGVQAIRLGYIEMLLDMYTNLFITFNCPEHLW